jgi:hypothetical protein
LDFLLRGLLSNVQETNFAAERWPELCPSIFPFLEASLVMPRVWRLTNVGRVARDWRQGDLGQPLHAIVLGTAEPDAGVVPAECKRDSFGVLSGLIVAVNYG